MCVYAGAEKRGSFPGEQLKPRLNRYLASQFGGSISRRTVRKEHRGMHSEFESAGNPFQSVIPELASFPRGCVDLFRYSTWVFALQEVSSGAPKPAASV